MSGGGGIPEDEARALARALDARALMVRAAAIRDARFGDVLTYSRKVFVPLTHLCRDSCHYCTFARPPAKGEFGYMRPDAVLELVRKAAEAGCTEVLFTLGDKPELRYAAARRELEELGHTTTLDYLAHVARSVLDQTGLLPHLNPGVMSAPDLAALRPVSASMGLMLESVSDRLCGRGMPHHGSPDKVPAVRLATIEAAGAAAVPFTTGLLIGIGETRAEIVEALLAIRALHERWGHIQEVIVQPFRAKPGTRMAACADAADDDLLWSIAVARLVLGADVSIQTPPNLAPGLIEEAVAAGIDDWGGLSPITLDHVNPDAPWPQIAGLADRLGRQGRVLVQRLPVYPRFALEPERWLDRAVRTAVLRASDASGHARGDRWAPGTSLPAPPRTPAAIRARTPSLDLSLDRLLARASAGEAPDADAIIRLFNARGGAFEEVCSAADEARRRTVGETVSYVVNRNINYTNVCAYRCTFCAFSKGKTAKRLRGPAYDLDAQEIARRVVEAAQRGATEVCLQGGIHPDYTGETYLAVVRAVKAAVPAMHVHAFSPLEVQHGAATLGVPIRAFLARLREAGLGSLPGTAAEILDNEVRAQICPDKVSTDEWLDIMAAAHAEGLRTTATIMFGHVERPIHWARHLLAIRALQERTGGFTELVPLPFVHMEAPAYFKGQARRGPTWREAVLMHAVARLVLAPVLANIQVSWVKMGLEGAAACLAAGANDLGGTLMNESISRAAGAEHGQELAPESMDAFIVRIGRRPRQRTTLYTDAPDNQRKLSYGASVLSAARQMPAGRQARLPGRSRPRLHPTEAHE